MPHTCSEGPYQGRYIRYFLTAATLLFVFFLSFLKIEDYDIWYHIKTGEYIVKNLSIPTTDIFSYTAFGHRWVTHEWLSEVIFYLFTAAAGVNNLVFFKAAMITAVFGSYLFFLRNRVGIHVLAPVVAVAAVLARGRFFERPELFSYLLVAVFICLLEKIRTDERAPGRYFWVFPALMVFWANCHGGAIFGVVITGAYAAGETAGPALRYVRGLIGAPCKEASKGKKKIKWFFLVFIATIAAGFVNPNTSDVYLYSFTVFDLMKRFGLQVLEFTPPSWDTERLFYIFFSVSALILALNIKRASPAHLILFAVFSLSAFRFRRNIAVWAMVSAPFIAIYVRASVDYLMERVKDRPVAGVLRKDFVPAVMNLSLIVVLTYVFIVSAARAGTLGPGIKKNIFPEGAVRFIEKAGIKGNMFNTYEFGGYLIWRTWPGRKVYLDGRADVYPEVFTDEMVLAPKGFVYLAEKYDINYAIIDYKEGNEEYMSADPFFRNMLALVYWDDVAMVYLKRTPENDAVIKKYEYRFVRPMDVDFRSVDPSSAGMLVAELERNIKENPSGTRNRFLLARACGKLVRCDGEK